MASRGESLRGQSDCFHMSFVVEISGIVIYNSCRCFYTRRIYLQYMETLSQRRKSTRQIGVQIGMKRKLVCLLMSIVFVLGQIPYEARAASVIIESGTCGDSVSWTIYNDGRMVIEGTGEMYDYNGLNHAPWQGSRYAIHSLEVRSGVTSVGARSFENCYNLEKVTCSETVLTIGFQAFERCSSLSEVKNSSRLNTIEGFAFSGCTSLAVFAIPKTVESLGYGAFCGCSALRKITIPKGVSKIETSTFSRCDTLESVILPNEITEIGEYAFYHCHKLGSILLPDSLTKVGNDAFAYCTALKEITIPGKVTEIESGAFQHCDELTAIQVPSDNPSFCSEDGFLFSKDKSVLVAAPCARTGTYYVPSSVDHLESESFRGCMLSHIILNEELRWYGENTFSESGRLEEMVLPQGITTSGYHEFLECDSLQSISFSENMLDFQYGSLGTCDKLSAIVADPGNPYYKTDSGVLFDGTGTKLLFCPRGKAGNYVVPDGVKEIDRAAFYSPNIRTLTLPEGLETIGSVSISGDRLFAVYIPASVTKIQWGAFRAISCPALRHVYYGGTAEQLQSITEYSIGDPRPFPSSAEIHYLCSGIDPVYLLPSAQYAFSWNDEQSPLQAVRNNENMILALTALAKLGYSKISDQWVGRTVAEFVDPSQGGYLEKDQTKDKIWRLDQDNEGNRYSKFYTDLIGSYEIVDYYDDNDSGFHTGFCAVTFKSPDGKYIICYRGSEGLDTIQVLKRFLDESYMTSNDWATDLDFALRNTLSDQFDFALSYYLLTAAKVGEDKIILTGHSLGGSLAAFVSVCTGARAYPIDGAVGRILDTTFWEASQFVTNFSGTDCYSFVNITDELGSNDPLFGYDGGDLIQAYETDRYPMITFRSVHSKDAVDLGAGSFESRRCGSHHQMSFLTYDTNQERYVLGEPTGEYGTGAIWKKDITDHTKVIKFGAGSGLLGGAAATFVGGPLAGIAGAAGAGVAGGWLAEKLNMFRMGRILVGSSEDDFLSPPGILLIDRLTNVVYGGTGCDRLIGHTVDDIIVANGDGTSIDGEGGADIYYINLLSGTVEIHDPGGDDTIFLNTWNLDETATSEDSERVYISDASHTVSIDKHRSFFSKDTIKVYIPDPETGLYKEYGQVALFSDEEAGLMEACDQLRYLQVEGIAEITILDKDGNPLETFSNEEGDCSEYTDNAYYYGYNNEDEAPHADIYLFNSAYGVQIVTEEGDVSIQTLRYDESENTPLVGNNYEDIAVDYNGYLVIDLTDEKADVYVMDESEDQKQINPTASFVYANAVTISQQEAELVCGDEYKLTVEAPSEGELLDGSWISSNPLIVSVEDGVIAAKAPGQAVISYVLGNGMAATCSVTVKERTISLSIEKTAGKLHYAIQNGRERALTLVAAQYDASGRMTNCDIIDPVGAQGYLEQPDTGRFKVFLIDANTGKPVCEAWDSDGVNAS